MKNNQYYIDGIPFKKVNSGYIQEGYKRIKHLGVLQRALTVEKKNKDKLEEYSYE